MKDVTGLAFRSVLDVAARHGVSAETLLRGLPLSEAGIRRGWKRYPWDDYVAVLERFAEELGGYERLSAAAGSAIDVLPEVAALCSVLLSPRAVYRFVYLVADPAAFPMVENAVDDVGPDRLRVSQTIAPGYRGSLAFHHGSVGALPHVPRYVGMAVARVEVVEIDERHTVSLVDLPPSRTVLARAGRVLSGDAVRQLLRSIGGDREALTLAYSSLQTTVQELQERNDALSQEVESRRRLETAVGQMLASVSNAAFLVTPAHVSGANAAGTRALDREGASLEARLRLAVEAPSTAIGLEVTSAGTPGHFLVLRKGIADEIDRRLDAACRRWGLTRRHGDVLRALVDGKSNAEIADDLGCTPRTVETHVTALLERADAPSRLALVASFWAAP